ncbi:MAG: hypothetical protein V1918_04945 [Planctomycetota bacterium]
MAQPAHFDAAAAQEAVSRSVDLVAAHWRTVAAVAAVSLLAVGAYAYANYRQEQAEDRAWAAMALAHQAANPALALDKVVRENPAARAVAFAEMESLRAHFELGEIAQARQAAETFLKSFPRHPFAPQVRADYARLLEWDARWDEAKRAYEAVIDSGLIYLQPEAYLGRARCTEELGALDAARSEYLTIQARGREERWPPRIVSTADFRLLALARTEEAGKAPVLPTSAPALEKEAPAMSATAEEGRPGGSATSEREHPAASATTEREHPSGGAGAP